MRAIPRLWIAALAAGPGALGGQEVCPPDLRSDSLVVWLVEGDPIDPSAVLRVRLQDTLVVEARALRVPPSLSDSLDLANRWVAPLPRRLPADSIVFRGIEGHRYREARPARIELVGDRCIAQLVALYDVSVRVNVSVTGGEPPPVDPAVRFAGLAAVAVSLANTNRSEELRAAAVAAREYLLRHADPTIPPGGPGDTTVPGAREPVAGRDVPDTIPAPPPEPDVRLTRPSDPDPRMADPAYDLAGVFLQLGDPVRAEELHRYAVAGREDPGYRQWTRDRYGIPEDATGDIGTLLDTSRVLSYIGLARALEARGLEDEARRWRARADSIQVATGLVVDTVPRYADDELEDPWGRKVLELNGTVGILNDEPEYTIEAIDIIRRDAIGTIRLGYITDVRVFFEAHAANSLIRIRVTSDEPGLQRNLNTWFFGGNLGFNLVDDDEPGRKLQLYGVLGAEAVLFNPDGLSRETDFSWIYGVGARYLLTSRVAIRSDLRMHHVRNALEKTLEGLAGLEAQDLQLLELSVGVSFLVWPGYPHRERDRIRREREAGAAARDPA